MCQCQCSSNADLRVGETRLVSSRRAFRLSSKSKPRHFFRNGAGCFILHRQMSIGSNINYLCKQIELSTTFCWSASTLRTKCTIKCISFVKTSYRLIIKVRCVMKRGGIKQLPKFQRTCRGSDIPLYKNFKWKMHRVYSKFKLCRFKIAVWSMSKMLVNHLMFFFETKTLLTSLNYFAFMFYIHRKTVWA